MILFPARDRLSRGADRFLLSAFCFLLSAFPSPAAETLPPLHSYEVRAVLLFKIAQLTDWPKEAFASDDAPFVLGILGDDPFKSDIDIVNGKLVKGHKLVVKHCSSAQEATECQLVFICSSEESRVPKIIKALENKSVMTVTEIEGITDRDGVIVNFGQTPTKAGLGNLHFEINRGAAEKAKLKINSQLLSLASKK
jgi:hypothetical protein